MAKDDTSGLNTLIKTALDSKTVKKNVSYNKPRKTYNETDNFSMVSKKPTNDQLKQYFSHIESLLVNIYYIKTEFEPFCPYCEKFLKDSQQIEWLRKLHMILKIDQKNVTINFIPCDWNCLETPLFRDDEESGKTYYSPQISANGNNYLIAFGMGVEHFPSLEIVLRSKSFKGGKEDLHRFVPAIGSKMEIEQTFEFLGIKERVKRKVDSVEILKPLLHFCRTLDLESASFSVHSKFSQKMGQYHRFTDNLR